MIDYWRVILRGGTRSGDVIEGRNLEMFCQNWWFWWFSAHFQINVVNHSKICKKSSNLRINSKKAKTKNGFKIEILTFSVQNKSFLVLKNLLRGLLFIGLLDELSAKSDIKSILFWVFVSTHQCDSDNYSVIEIMLNSCFRTAQTLW